MSANNDILLGYFNSLLVSDVSDVADAFVDKQGLSDMLEVATAPAQTSAHTSAKTESSALSSVTTDITDSKPTYHFVLADTIVSGQRLIPLMATSAVMNSAITTTAITTAMTFTNAMSLTMRLELLSLAAKLTPGRLKQHVLASCKGEAVDGGVINGEAVDG